MNKAPLDKSTGEAAKQPATVVPKKGAQLEWVRRASVIAGVALLFIVFSRADEQLLSAG